MAILPEVPGSCFSGVHNINSFREHTKLFFTNKRKSSNSTGRGFRLDSKMAALVDDKEAVGTKVEFVCEWILVSPLINCNISSQ